MITVVNGKCFRLQGLLFGLAASLLAGPARGQDWDVDHPPGPSQLQTIDTREGTWMNVDVHPNGKEIVFDLLGDLYTMDIPDSGAVGTPKALTSGRSWDMQPRYSPDGEWIAFTSDRTGKSGKGGDNIWILKRDGSETRQITDESYRLLNGPTWSPDGEYVVARKHFTSRRSLGAGEMWMYHRSGVEAGAGGGIQLTSRPNDQKDVNEPVFSPDGRYLYFSRDASPGGTFEYSKDSNQQIYIIERLDLEKGETEAFVTGPGGACRPTPSPDGKTLAFVRRVNGKSALHLLDLESGGIRWVYDGLERDMQETWAIHGVYPTMAWMPDGRSIVFWAGGQIRRLNVVEPNAPLETLAFHLKDTREVTPAVRFSVDVAPQKFPVRMLRWVHLDEDGDESIFQALGHIYRRPIKGEEPVRLNLAEDHFEYYPQLSRDGTYLAYVAWNDQSLGAIHVWVRKGENAGKSWKVTSQAGHYRDLAISPDNQKIVFIKSSGGGVVSPMWSRETGVYVVDLEGGKPELVTRNGSQPQFGSGSDRVFLTRSNGSKDADNTKLVSMALNGTEEREHFTSTWATEFAVSPDEKWISFVEGFHVYVAAFPKVGQILSVGPGTKNFPTQKLSDEAGEWIRFSSDSDSVTWAHGPTLYRSDLKDWKSKVGDGAGKQPEVEEINLSFEVSHARPDREIVLTHGKILTMNGDEMLEDGMIWVKGNRIQSVEPMTRREIPKGVEVIDLGGRWVMPGLVDTHAHGSQGMGGIVPQHNWVNYARLAFGVTTVHDPSNDTETIFASKEMVQAGLVTGPRTFSTGTILYGATGAYKADIQSLDDARFHLKRMQKVGAFSVKSYNQPRRDQRQQVLAAGRNLGIMVVPEGGSTLYHNLTMIVDGHTGIEHSIPLQWMYKDILDLWRGTGVGYTPTLSVAYGGIWGENYWYQVDELWKHERLNAFIPPQVLHPRARRRTIAPEEDYNHFQAARLAKQVVDLGGLAQAGGHGQLNGICTHWEMWMMVQGGMTPFEALRSGSLHGAKYLGLDNDIGSLKSGKLADLIIFEEGRNPVKSIRDSEAIEWVMANGILYHAPTMNRVSPEPQPRPDFFWQRPGLGGRLWFPMENRCVGCQ